VKFWVTTYDAGENLFDGILEGAVWIRGKFRSKFFYCLSRFYVPVCLLVPMEQMMAHLLLALKEIENTETPDDKARDELRKAVNQAIKMRSRWRVNWGLIN